MMYDPQKSDSCIVAGKPANKLDGVGAEPVERRREAEGNTGESCTHRTQSRASVSQRLERVRERAKLRKKERFTSLLHHVDVDLLRWAYSRLKRDAAPGVDGETWQQYGEELEANLADLHARVHRGAYRPQPSRRTYIAKADGRERPLGIATVEDKVLQRAVTALLNAIYEVDFQGFSYGFRPGRSQHDALDALAVGISRRKLNWILDADIESFFDSVSQHAAQPESNDAGTDALSTGQAGPVAATRGGGLLQLSRGAEQSVAMAAFRYRVLWLWHRSLRRRSQRDCTSWARMYRLADRWIPRPTRRHPWPERRFFVKHPRWEPSARIVPARICVGCALKRIEFSRLRWRPW